MSGKKLIFLIFSLYLVLFNLCANAQEDSLYYTNPSYHIASELFKKRMIMLGGGHSWTFSYKRLIEVLDNWLEICENTTDSVNLTLVIEDDSQSVSILNGYLSTGNINPILDDVAPTISLQDLEYYQMLRGFCSRVDSVNRYKKLKINFRIAGFEPTTDSNYYSYLSKKPKKESELWFINIRDSIVAHDIIEYSEQYPNGQILIYYGPFHLQNGFVNKNLGFEDLSNEELMGYCLAHYLKNHFGEDKILTFIEINYYLANLKLLFKDPIMELKRNTEFIFRPQELIYPVYSETLYDNIVNIHAIKAPAIFLNYVCSRYVLERTLEKIIRIKNSLPGYKASNEYKKHLKGSKLLTGIDFDNDSEFNDWATDNTYNGTGLLYNNILSDTLEKLFVKVKDKNFINSIISLYGVSFDVSDSDMISFENWREKKLPQILNQIKFTNSIGIYWIGYPDEKIKAKEYLVKFSGEDFAEPEKYLQWYRMKYYGYEY